MSTVCLQNGYWYIPFFIIHTHFLYSWTCRCCCTPRPGRTGRMMRRRGTSSTCRRSVLGQYGCISFLFYNRPDPGLEISHNADPDPEHWLHPTCIIMLSKRLSNIFSYLLIFLCQGGGAPCARPYTNWSNTCTLCSSLPISKMASSNPLL